MATAQVNAQASLMPLSTFAGLSVSAQQAYVSSLDPSVAPQYQAAMMSGIDAANRDFMLKTRSIRQICNQASGTAQSQAYAAGSLLSFVAPNVNNGYVRGFWLRVVTNVQLAAGTAALYSAAAAAPLNLFTDCEIIYGRTVHKFSPYILKQLAQLRGFLKQPFYNTVIGGQSNATLQGYRSSTPFTAAVGANNWTYEVYIPLNMIHPSDVRGLLPCYDNNVQVQINLQCAPLSMGGDAINNPVYMYSGTGGSATITGTVVVEADIVDGRTITQVQQLRPTLDGLPSVRLMRDQPLNSLTSGNTIRNKISLVGQHAYYILTIVDALQNSKFASLTNLVELELGPDASGANLFTKYGSGTNMSVYEFYNELFNKIGQDMDEGIIPLVTGPIDNIADASLLEGHNFLNTTPNNGWINANYGVWLNSVGSGGNGPRVEAHALYLSDPLQIVSR